MRIRENDFDTLDNNDKIKDVEYALPRFSLNYCRLKLPTKVGKDLNNAQKRLNIFFDDSKTAESKAYNGDERMIYGLTKWYRKHNAEFRDIILISVLDSNSIQLKFSKNR